MPRLEQQMGVGAVGDRRAVEGNAYAARRRLEQDLVIGIVVEPGFAPVDQFGHCVRSLWLLNLASRSTPEMPVYRAADKRGISLRRETAFRRPPATFRDRDAGKGPGEI